MKAMKPEKISKEVIRRFLCLKQRLFEEKRGKEETLEAIKQLECVQVDPIKVVHRNHHLVLYNRVADYTPYYLEKLLYEDRSIFEYWCNEKSIIPIEDFKYFRYRMQNPSQFHSPFYERIKAQRKELKSEISYVLAEIRNCGALSSKEFEQKGKIKGKLATKILNLLWDCSELIIHHIEGNRRYYDLTERVLPSEILDEEVPSKEDYVRFMIEKYMKAYRLIDTRDWRFGWLPLKVSERKDIVEEMVKVKKLCLVKVEGIKHSYYVLEEDLSLLENSEMLKVDERAYFIAPLDNLLWNRKMVSEVFEFNYSWEVYKIPEKRVYGYYVMPILYGTSFIGRLDPMFDRRNEKMIIHSLYLEGVKLNEKMLFGLGAALHRFIQFHEASQVDIEKTYPKKLKALLMRQLRTYVN